VKEKGDRVRLAHILEYAELVSEWLSRVRKESFFDNKQLQASIIRQIEVIGEATKNVSPSLKEKHPEIPWKEISGMRDMLIHEYFDVDLEEVWVTCTEDIPELVEKIKTILSEMDSKL